MRAIVPALILIPVLFFFAAIISTLAGCAIGWAVGTVFPSITDLVATMLWQPDADIAAWQIGGVLGFIVGCFFRAAPHAKSE